MRSSRHVKIVRTILQIVKRARIPPYLMNYEFKTKSDFPEEHITEKIVRKSDQIFGTRFF
jgi:hypothetical protein